MGLVFWASVDVIGSERISVKFGPTNEAGED
jgi:hypothetical protein